MSATQPQRRAGTPPREDGDEALQAFQDALFHRLTPGLGTDEGPPVRVFAWTVDDAHLAPEMQRAFELLEEGHRLFERAIPADEPGATHSEAPTLLLEVTRLERIPGTGQQWHGLIPMGAATVRDAFAAGASRSDRGWLLDTLERQVLETFWRTAYAAPAG